MCYIHKHFYSVKDIKYVDTANKLFTKLVISVSQFLVNNIKYFKEDKLTTINRKLPTKHKAILVEVYLYAYIFLLLKMILFWF